MYLQSTEVKPEPYPDTRRPTLVPAPAPAPAPAPVPVPVPGPSPSTPASQGLSYSDSDSHSYSYSDSYSLSLSRSDSHSHSDSFSHSQLQLQTRQAALFDGGEPYLCTGTWGPGLGGFSGRPGILLWSLSRSRGAGPLGAA